MTFKQRLASGERIVGTFVKTPSPMLFEVLALSALDCLCLDAEHSPFDRGDIDCCVAAARAGDKPVLVRVPVASPEQVLNALDCGATGVLAPHVRSVADVEALARACQYGAGGRGYAGSSRAAGYTTVPMARHIANSQTGVVAIAQIEDLEAVDAIEAIAAVPGIDALFVGRADLTVAYGAQSQDDPRVNAAVERICAAGKAQGRTVGMFLARIEDVAFWAERGASLFLLSSDHTFILQGAADLMGRTKG